jgi:hypothetical protein
MSFVQDLFVNNDSNVVGALVIGQSTAPDASADLEIDNFTKGLLFPRMTTIQKDAIISPVTGLMIYSTRSTGNISVNGN